MSTEGGEAEEGELPQEEEEANPEKVGGDKEESTTQPPLTCKHSYCTYQRGKKVNGYAPPKPKGLPWSTGLVRCFPGKIPLLKRGEEYPPKAPNRRVKFYPNLMVPLREDRDGTKEQMIFFLRVFALANDLKDGKYPEEDKEEKKSEPPIGKEEAQQEAGDQAAPPADPGAAPPAEDSPLPAEETPPPE